MYTSNFDLAGIFYFSLAIQELRKQQCDRTAVETFEQLLFCIGQLIKDHTDLCLVLGTNLPTSLYSARRFLKN